MADEGSGFKVADRRLFTDTGDLREDAPERDADRPSSSQQVFDSAPPKQSKRGDLPVTFQSLVLSLSTTAMFQLGLAPNPTTNKPEQDLPAAKQTIEILELLKEKTQGNLNSEESQLLQNCLYDLKMTFVQASKRSS